MTLVDTQGHSSIGSHSMPMHSDPGKPTQGFAPQRSQEDPRRGSLEPLSTAYKSTQEWLAALADAPERPYRGKVCSG